MESLILIAILTKTISPWLGTEMIITNACMSRYNRIALIGSIALFIRAYPMLPVSRPNIISLGLTFSIVSTDVNKIIFTRVCRPMSFSVGKSKIELSHFRSVFVGLPPDVEHCLSDMRQRTRSSDKIMNHPCPRLAIQLSRPTLASLPRHSCRRRSCWPAPGPRSGQRRN